MSRLPRTTGLPMPRSGIARPAGMPIPRAGPSGTASGSRIASLAQPSSRVPGAQPTPGRPAAAGARRPPAPGVPSRAPAAAAQSRLGSRPPPSGSKQVASTTQVTLTKRTGEQTTRTTTDRSVVPKVATAPSKGKLGAPVGRRRSQAAVPIPPPSVLRKQVALEVKATAAKSTAGSRVTAVGAKRTSVPPMEKIVTPSGPQQVLQKVITERRVERSKHGETVSRNVKTIETDPCTGETTQLEQEVQMLNPEFAITEGPVKEIVTIVSQKDITASYETRSENIVRETTKLDAGLGIDLERVSQLVEEEKEDVENALRINPPDLVNQSPEKYPLRKKLQTLKLSPENVALLEQSVMEPPISPDDPLPEASPEVMAKVMNAMDKSMEPKMDPEATFNTLFTEGGAAEPSSAMISISSAAPGPLGDVVVPNESLPELVQTEMLSRRMEEVSVIVQTADEKPADYAFTVRAPVAPRQKGKRKGAPYKALTEEDPPWGKEDMAEVSMAVGALPKENLDVSSLLETTISGKVNEEVDKGIEYYLDVDPIQYCSRVQLRGSQPPVWFPGYIYALSDLGVSVAKSPSQVMFAAWRSVQPEIFPDDSIVYN